MSMSESLFQYRRGAGKIRVPPHHPNVCMDIWTDIFFSALYLLFFSSLFIFIIYYTNQLLYIYYYIQSLIQIYVRILYYHLLSIFYGHIRWLYSLLIIYVHNPWSYLISIISLSFYEGDKVTLHITISTKDKKYLLNKYGKGYVSAWIRKKIREDMDRDPEQRKLKKEALEKQLAEINEVIEVHERKSQEIDNARAAQEREKRNQQIAEFQKNLLRDITFYKRNEKNRDRTLSDYILVWVKKLKELDANPIEFLEESQNEEGVIELLPILREVDSKYDSD